MSDVVLSAGVRQNLLALQSTAKLMSITQTRLATGKKVNTALDNPANFFTAAGLSARASDLSGILDAMSSGLQTIQAANNGLTTMTNLVQQLQATAQQAMQDSTFKTASYTIDAATIGTTTLKNLSFSGGSVGATPVNIALNTIGAGSAATSPVLTAGTAFGALDETTGDETYSFNVTDSGGTPVTITLTNAADTNTDNSIDETEAITAINAQLTSASSNIRVLDNGGALEFFDNTGATGASRSITVDTFTTGGTTPLGTFGFGASATASGADAVPPGAVKTVDDLVNAINADASLIGKVKASNDNGKLRIQNLSLTDLTVTGATSTAVDGSTSTQTVGGNTFRSNLVTQFNNLISQINSVAGDSSFNGVNLLNGDVLKLVFNETNTSSLSLQSQNPNGVNTTTLGITLATATEFGDNSALGARLTQLQAALTSLRSQASDFGSSLSIVQNRQDFTKNMINTLQVGADNLTLADTNEEGANMLALQTRQQLSTTSLSLAAQADQAVLRLFG
jgi:flagellin-like hook-associated protein FlgL